MPALYPERSNTVFRVTLVLLILFAAGAITAPMVCVRTPYVTNQTEPVDQPVEFDHRHHVRDDGIQCLYCHGAAEVSPSAGIPPTELCLGCHVQIWNQSPLLEPVRQSWATGTPIPWRRVHDLPDFAYFNHAVHVTRGIGCVICHGRVDEMPRVYKVASLHMNWCMDCHREPEAFIRNEQAAQQSTYGNPGGDAMWGLPADRLELERFEPRTINRRTTCSACHR